MSDLKLLEQLMGLTRMTQLMLNLTSSQVSDLKPLEQLTGLTQLTLNLSYQVSDLKPLEQLKGLTQLTLDLGSVYGKVKDLEILAQLPQLQALSIEEATTEQRKSLRNLPASLVELKF